MATRDMAQMQRTYIIQDMDIFFNNFMIICIFLN